MVVTLQNHSGMLITMTCIIVAEPKHQLFHVSSAVTHCPQCPERASGAPMGRVYGQDQALSTPALGRFIVVSLTSVLDPSLSLENTPPNHVSLTSMLNSSSRTATACHLHDLRCYPPPPPEST